MDLQPMIVVAVAVASGSALGHIITMRIMRRAFGKAMASVVAQAVAATSVMATLYIDTMIEHAKLTQEEAAKKLVDYLKSMGIPVSQIILRDRSNDVHKA